MFPGPFVTVTLTLPPGAVVPVFALIDGCPVVGGGLGFVAAPTVTGALAARRVNVSFEKKRSWYTPWLDGMTKVNVAALSPEAGTACEFDRYFQAMNVRSESEARASATQSRRLAGPLAIFTVTLAPGVAVVGVTVTTLAICA
jgi:hypothetical protein